VIGDEACELRLRRGARKVYAVSPCPPQRARNPRYKRRLRDHLRNTGISFDSCWRVQRVRGYKQVTFCVFSLSERLLRRQNDERILDLLEGDVKTIFDSAGDRALAAV
jgi:hypothetical protein